MAFYKNTKDNFWASIDASHDTIICPCCGTPLSLQYSASYRLMLTREASVHLNQQLSFYRRTIEAVERILKRHNSDAFSDVVKGSPFPLDDTVLSDKGLFTTQSGTATRDLLYKLDVERLEEIIHKWPKLNELAQVGDNPKKFTSQQILQVIQMPILSAGLNKIAFDQASTEATLTQYKPSAFINAIQQTASGNTNNPVFDYLLNKFPYFFAYCSHFAANPSDECLTRAMALLIVYFGHGAEQNSPTSQSDSKAVVTTPSEFTFGTYAQVRNWQSLAELLTSYFYVSALQSPFPEFCAYVRNHDNALQTQASDPSGFKLGSFDNVEKLRQWKAEIPQFENVVLYTVDFACSGLPVTIPKDATVTIRRKNEKVERPISLEIANMVEAEICGWVPKEQNTENLLLVGGTASSKTTLLQSTLVQVKRAAANLGMVFETTSPLSNLLLQHYEQQYDSNKWEGATESGDRTSIQIALRQASDPSKIFYLVINDIAGEHFEEMLMIEKDFSVIQSPLSHARHIVFLFDLIAWRQLNALIHDTTDQGSWKTVMDAGEEQAKVGRAVIDSRDLMVKLVARLVASSGADHLPIERSFILVIPKCDLYIKEGMFLNGWVTSLSKKGYVKRLGDQEDSPYMSTWKFKREGDTTTEFDAALQGISEMSDLASSAIKELATKISEQENSVSAERVAINIASMLTYLEQTFSDVKVVPVSALGKAPENTGQAASAKFTSKAVPLFCEALLLLPMIKMRATQPSQDTDSSDS